MIIILLLTQNIFFIQAQNTSGTDFYLTFGKNSIVVIFDYQIRFVCGSESTEVTIYFTDLQTSISFPLQPHQVQTYELSATEKQAVRNTTTGTTNKSAHITSLKPISVYALNQSNGSTDATNVFPVTTLDINYYDISYYANDAYAVIAISNNTSIEHNGEQVAILNEGQVYYRTLTGDMTGVNITANNPIALFALNEMAFIPTTHGAADCLMQQLPPINTWGKNIFVPVSNMGKDRVRIVVSEDDTNIIQKGGELKSATGSQMSLDNLQAGQFVELEVNLDSAGCYIQSNKPVGVCSYLTGRTYNDFNISDPSQCWVPPVEQMVTQTMIAPFYSENSNINAHYALVVTPTDTKDNTLFSIGGEPYVALSGGSWEDHQSGISFYNIPLIKDTESYRFTNNNGLFVLCYGVGYAESYYYLGGSAVRTLDAAFYANDIHCGDLENNQICEKEVFFRAEIENMGVEVDSIKWFIDDAEFEPAQNQETGDYTFTQGEYEITMEVYYFENGETKTKTITGTLKRKDFWVKMRNVKH